jgi:hypothetical protein
LRYIAKMAGYECAEVRAVVELYGDFRCPADECVIPVRQLDERARMARSMAGLQAPS